jgi:hypothetical protein
LALLALAASIFFLALPTPKPIPKENDELNLVEIEPSNTSEGTDRKI